MEIKINYKDVDAHLIPFEYELESILPDLQKHAEICGRTCYKSFDKMTEDSYGKFFKMIVNNHHLSVLEHCPVYFTTKNEENPYVWTGEKAMVRELIDNIQGSHFSKRELSHRATLNHISTNLRVVIEEMNNLKDYYRYPEEVKLETILKYACKPNKFHHKRLSIRVFCPIEITREINRHRDLSISESSTRYIDMSNADTFKPLWYDNAPSSIKERYDKSIIESLKGYQELLKNKEIKLTKQDVRGLLPLGTMSEVVYTAFKEDLLEAISKREVKAAHPIARKTVWLIKRELEKADCL